MRKTFAVLALVMLLQAFSVLAATNFQSILNPANDDTVSGTIILRVEVNGSNYNVTQNVTNVTFYAWDYAGNETILGTNVSNVNNWTLSNWTLLFDTAGLEDARSSYTFGVRLRNVSNGFFNATNNTGIIVDNTNPTFAFTQAANTEFNSRTETITVTVGLANGTTCLFNFGSNVYTGTLSGTSCTRTLSRGNPSDYVYSVTVTATDGVDSVTSVPRSFIVDFAGNGNAASPAAIGEAGAGQFFKSQKNKTVLLVMGAAVILLMAVNGKKR